MTTYIEKIRIKIKHAALLTNHKKSKIQTETNHVKETLDNLNHQNNNPAMSISHNLGKHNETGSKYKLRNDHEIKWTKIKTVQILELITQSPHKKMGGT